MFIYIHVSYGSIKMELEPTEFWLNKTIGGESPVLVVGSILGELISTVLPNMFDSTIMMSMSSA